MIKAAAYCRVSTDHEDQANSFETQQRYFREYIERQPDWELYDVYADEGTTGTSTRKRTQFNRMINDAYEGKFQLIITKEVSRFSRNILDTISYTRELKAISVAVQFLTDDINTITDPNAELKLSIMASIAQEESRKTGSRVTWGQQRQMEQGVVFGRSLLGYDVTGGKLHVNQEGAKIVRLIFQKYALEQMRPKEIAAFLQGAGYRTLSGNPKWSTSHLIKILRNEKYAGDLVQRKTITPDFLTHQKKANRGEVPLIRIENHHEPIVSRELWNLAQETLRKRNKHNGEISGHSNRYVFSGKIRCGECGAGFVGRQKTRSDGTKERRWSCHTAVKEGSRVYKDEHGISMGCDVGKLVRDDEARNMLKTALKSLSIDTRAVINNVTALALEAIQAGEGKDTPEWLQYEIERTEKKKESVMDSFFSGDITGEEMQVMKCRYEKQLENLRDRLLRAQTRRTESKDTEQLRADIQQEVAASLSCEIESELLYKNLLDHITVFKDHRMELRLNHLPQMFRFIG